MPRHHRAVLGVSAAISALILSSGAAAQAATVHPPKPSASAHYPSLIRPASSRAIANAPSGDVTILSLYPGGGYLTSNGEGKQATLGDVSGNVSWEIEPITAVDSRGGEWVTIMNLTDGLCLDAQDNATGSPNTNGDHVNSWGCDLAKQQQWYLWPLGNGVTMIVSGFNTNKVLDGRTELNCTPSPGHPCTPSDQGDPVQVWDHLGDAQQSWEIS